MARELRQMTSRCLLGTDQPVTELHDSLHFTEAAGIGVDISPGTGDRSCIPRPQPSTPRVLPGGRRYPGRGTRDHNSTTVIVVGLAVSLLSGEGAWGGRAKK